MKAKAMMDVSTAEREQLRAYYEKLQGRATELEGELGRLLNNMEEVAALTYARRALEVIVTEICQNELKRGRGSEPLEGILDRFARERIIPEYIIVSMRNLNRLGTFGAHPKPFTSQQVREAFIALTTTVDWYVVEYRKLSPGSQAGPRPGPEPPPRPEPKPQPKPEPAPQPAPVPRPSRYKYIVAGIFLVVLIIAAGLYSSHHKIAASNSSGVQSGAHAQKPAPAPANAPPPAQSPVVYRYGMVCLKNLTGVPIHYFFRWGDSGEWGMREIAPGDSHWHSWKYASGSRVSPDLHIKFDATLNGGDMKEYVLKRYAATAQECRLGKTYEFVPVGNIVGLEAEK